MADQNQQQVAPIEQTSPMMNVLASPKLWISVTILLLVGFAYLFGKDAGRKE